MTTKKLYANLVDGAVKVIPITNTVPFGVNVTFSVDKSTQVQLTIGKEFLCYYGKKFCAELREGEVESVDLMAKFEPLSETPLKRIRQKRPRRIKKPA